MLKEHSLIVHGKKAAYWSNEKKDKPAVLFLHGFPGNHKGMIYLANFFLEDYHVIMPDFPGCGKSQPMDGSHSVASYAVWAHGFLQALSLKHTVVLGHSFGARVAVSLAASYPMVIKKVVLVTPVVTVDSFISKLASAHYGLIRLLPDSWSKKYLSSKIYQSVVFLVTFTTNNKKLRQEIMRQSMQEMKTLERRVNHEVFDDLHRLDLGAVGEGVTSECLVVAAKKDKVASLRSVIMFTRRVKRSSLNVVKTAGHLLPIEHPKFTAETIQSWLRNS